MPSASGRRPVTAVRTTTAARRNLVINRLGVGCGLRGALWAVRHGAYDMRYGRQETEIAHARPPNDPHDRRRRGSAPGGDDGFRAEDQPVPQTPLPGAAR